MSARQMRVPGPDHPISVALQTERVTVFVADAKIAETTRALILREAGYSPVHYIPREDVDMSLLERSSHQTHCPYKGECSYYSIPSGGTRAINAVWTYEEPYEAVAAIKGYLAFYPDRVDAIQVGEPPVMAVP